MLPATVGIVFMVMLLFLVGLLSVRKADRLRREDGHKVTGQNRQGGLLRPMRIGKGDKENATILGDNLNATDSKNAMKMAGGTRENHLVKQG